jgi:hypothetical protein
MKLLFDENLSHKLVLLLQDLFPASIHVRDVGLKAADDPFGMGIRKRQQSNSDLEGLGHASAKFYVRPSPESNLGAFGQLLNRRD